MRVLRTAGYFSFTFPNFVDTYTALHQLTAGTLLFLNFLLVFLVKFFVVHLPLLLSVATSRNPSVR